MARGEKVAVLDIPLLFETGGEENEHRHQLDGSRAVHPAPAIVWAISSPR